MCPGGGSRQGRAMGSISLGKEGFESELRRHKAVREARIIWLLKTV